MPSSTARSILLVEDDPDTRVGIADALARVGYRVTVASSGCQALDMLRSDPVRPALIILDWQMPVPDGIGFLSSQAADLRNGLIPVIVLSEIGRMEKIPSLSVSAVLTKPVRMRTLLEVVDRLCGVPLRGPDGVPLERRSSHAITHIGIKHQRAPETAASGAARDHDTIAIRRQRTIPD